MTPHSYKRADTIHVIAVWLARCIRLSMDTADTHKASTCVTKRWPLIRHFMEVMRVFEVEAQLGTYRHSPHEVRVDFLTADLSFSGQKMFQSATQQWVSQVEGFRNHSTAHVVSCFFFSFAATTTREAFEHCSFLTCQFRECRRKRGSWLLFSQSPPVKCSHPDSGRNFSSRTAGGNRAIRYSVALVKEQLVSSALGCQVIRKWKTWFCCRVTYSHPPSVWRV